MQITASGTDGVVNGRDYIDCVMKEEIPTTICSMPYLQQNKLRLHSTWSFIVKIGKITHEQITHTSRKRRRQTVFSPLPVNHHSG